MISEIVMFILEIIGTISFAVSGAVIAIKARLDIFGVVFIGAITAIGGGIVRDLLIGKIPPAVFLNFYLFIIAVVTSIIVFVITYINRHKFNTLEGTIEYVNNFFDAIGLAAFSIMGTEVSFAENFSDNMFFSVTLGMLTGIGGGIFRDILTDTTPFVLKKHIYASASILGSCTYYILRKNIDNMITASVISMLLIFSIRVLSAKYRWSLPKIKLENKSDLS